MNERDRLAAIARETVEISRRGEYRVGSAVIRLDGGGDSRLFRAEEFPSLIKALDGETPRFSETAVQVRREGTVDAVFRLARGRKRPELGALNFASAHSPGGGFLKGAPAQEECLARCSDLYLKQTTGEGPKYYEINDKTRGTFYTDTMLLSGVTFFRDSANALTRSPAVCRVLSVPAVNWRLVERDRAAPAKARAVMRERMRRSLYAFAAGGCTELILGAFGCGVFGNDPETVAEDWRTLLESDGLNRFFRRITFSVYDRPGRDGNFSIFRRVLGGPAGRPGAE